VSGGHDDRGAEGVSIEAPKAPSGVRYGEGCPLPSRLRGLRERRELPSGVRGRATAAIAFSAYFRPQNASGSFCMVATVTTTIKSGGDKLQSSHTKLRL